MDKSRPNAPVQIGQQIRQLREKRVPLHGDLLLSYLSDQVFYQLEDEERALEALKVAEEKMLYRKNAGNGQPE